MKFRLNGLPPRGICTALIWVWAMAGLLAGCVATAMSQELGVITFDEVLSETGIGFVHFAGDSGKNYLYETVLSGIVTFDYDSDGWVDLLLLSGTSKNQSTYGNRLYRNLGGWRFVDVTESAGIRDDSFSLGATVGDYDNDGDPDLFLNNFGRNVLYCNQGDGSFVRSNIELISQHERVGAGACFLDMDQDGCLDLWVGNYIKFNRENTGQRLLFGVATAEGPKAYPSDEDQLFRNDQNGRFEDVSESSGIGKIQGATMGMIAFDYDRDGDTGLRFSRILRPTRLIGSRFDWLERNAIEKE